MAFVQLLRPHQWIKNVFVFAGLVFGQKLFEPGAVTKALLGFLLLSLVSSTIYIFNDIHDRAEDRLHRVSRVSDKTLKLLISERANPDITDSSAPITLPGGRVQLVSSKDHGVVVRVEIDGERPT